MDRFCLDMSSKMAEPFCRAWHLLAFRALAPVTPHFFENRPTLVQEVAVRALIGVGSAAFCLAALVFPKPVLGGLLTLAVLSRVFRCLGFSLQQGQCTHVKGEALEKPLGDSLKLMAWNICGVAGGLSLDHGGVLHWRERLQAIVQTIEREDPDVLVLQEIYDTQLAEALIANLKSRYAHFFLHLGANTWGIGSGLMVLSKCSLHDFQFSSFTAKRNWQMNRGCAILELKKDNTSPTPCVRIVGTHFNHGPGEENHQIRVAQTAEMVNAIAKRHFAIPTVVCGDWNIERDAPEGQFLHSYFTHGYQSREPTCTNGMTAKWERQSPAPDEIIDYLSSLNEQPAVLHNVHRIEAFDPQSPDPKTALSDHQGLVADIKVLG